MLFQNPKREKINISCEWEASIINVWLSVFLTCTFTFSPYTFNEKFKKFYVCSCVGTQDFFHNTFFVTRLWTFGTINWKHFRQRLWLELFALGIVCLFLSICLSRFSIPSAVFWNIWAQMFIMMRQNDPGQF